MATQKQKDARKRNWLIFILNGARGTLNSILSKKYTHLLSTESQADLMKARYILTQTVHRLTKEK